MKYAAVARAWLTELWVNVRCQPWQLAPCAHPARGIAWWQGGGEYVCHRCGSSSRRVQRKGRAHDPRPGRELA